jgi:hypothetical protein
MCRAKRASKKRERLQNNDASAHVLARLAPELQESGDGKTRCSSVDFTERLLNQEGSRRTLLCSTQPPVSRQSIVQRSWGASTFKVILDPGRLPQHSAERERPRPRPSVQVHFIAIRENQQRHRSPTCGLRQDHSRVCPNGRLTRWLRYRSPYVHLPHGSKTRVFRGSRRFRR